MAVRKLNNNLNVIGENLRNYRKEKHLSQADLTMELNLLGINLHKNDVYMIENNKRSEIKKRYPLYLAFEKYGIENLKDIIGGAH